MPQHSNKHYAVDIGNSRIKVGEFESCNEITEPLRTLELSANQLGHDEAIAEALNDWLQENASNETNQWWISSVNWSLTARFSGAVERIGAGSVTTLSKDNLPIKVHVESPESVGIDRLLAAIAANHLRNTNQPAIVVDLGTAITVDLVSADGAFEGGAILPGIGMAAKALEEQTDALPLVPMVDLNNPPAPIGKSTVAAIESGIFWGAVGAIRELVLRYIEELKKDSSNKETITPDFFLTGGAAPQVAQSFSDINLSIHHEPHLVLYGIVASIEQSPCKKQ